MSKLNHACRGVCSGWDAGYGEGQKDANEKYYALLEQAEKLAELVQACYDDFNCGGEKKLEDALSAFQKFKEQK